MWEHNLLLAIVFSAMHQIKNGGVGEINVIYCSSEIEWQEMKPQSMWIAGKRGLGWIHTPSGRREGKGPKQKLRRVV